MEFFMLSRATYPLGRLRLLQRDDRQLSYANKILMILDEEFGVLASCKHINTAKSTG